jgi:hypothetical protein
LIFSIKKKGFGKRILVVKLSFQIQFQEKNISKICRILPCQRMPVPSGQGVFFRPAVRLCEAALKLRPALIRQALRPLPSLPVILADDLNP